MFIHNLILTFKKIKSIEVASQEELDALQGRRVGPATRNKLNQLFK